MFIILTEPILRGHALSFELIKHGFIWNDSRTARHTWNSRLTDQKHCEKLQDPFERSCFYQDGISLFCSQRMRCSYYGRRLTFQARQDFLSNSWPGVNACVWKNLVISTSGSRTGVLRCAAQSALKSFNTRHDSDLLTHWLLCSQVSQTVENWHKLGLLDRPCWLVIRVQGQWSLLLRWFAWFIHNGTAKDQLWTPPRVHQPKPVKSPAHHSTRIEQWVIINSISGLFLRFMLNGLYTLPTVGQIHLKRLKI